MAVPQEIPDALVDEAVSSWQDSSMSLISLASILPRVASVCELIDEAEPDRLYPEEELLVERAVPKRRREFALSRTCARRALAGLGIRSFPILSAVNRAPIWPSGVVGSITHCDSYTAAAVCLDRQFRSIGIDAEVNERLPKGTLEFIALPSEQAALQEFSNPQVCWDRLLFSAKESIFKAWSTLSHGWLDFLQAEVVIDPIFQSFRANLLVDSPATGDFIDGRFQVSRDHILTAVTVRRGPADGGPRARERRSRPTGL
jgi:4'-phosphopantetheinyl transferase EntD